MKPAPWKPVASPPEIAWPTNPPMSEPATPSTVVMMKPIDWRPGTSARAMSPMMNPNTIQAMIPIGCLPPARKSRHVEVPRPAGSSGGRAHVAHTIAHLARDAPRQRGPGSLTGRPPAGSVESAFRKGFPRAASPLRPRARVARRVRSHPVHERARGGGRRDRGSPLRRRPEQRDLRVHRRRGLPAQGARGGRQGAVRAVHPVRVQGARPRPRGAQEGARGDAAEGEPVMRARLLLAALAVAAAACATGGKLRENAAVARADIEKARRSGGARCAPKELALAEANVDFAEAEISQGNATRAQEHLQLAETNVKRALD